MATTFKTFMNNDVVSTRTLLHEAIPVTGTIASGTYGAWQAEENVRNFSHGMFQSIYDYPYLSSSANHIFDITFGYHSSSVMNKTATTTTAADGIYGGAASTQNNKKINIYNQMAQVLVGYDTTGSILQFDRDGDFSAGGLKLNECFFLSFSRLLSKDEIKKGSFSLEMGVTQAFDHGDEEFAETWTLKDTGAENDYRVNSPAGEYGILYLANSIGTPLEDSHTTSTSLPGGLIYYQAGVVVITASAFVDNGIGTGTGTGALEGGDLRWLTNTSANASFLWSNLTASNIQNLADGFRNRINNISFNNTTELNSSIYFCRANHNEFNYSSNPTYLSGSKIFVKENTLDTPVSYITTIGLYSADSELLAAAKLSEPLKKDPNTELTLRVRLDY